MVDNHEILNLLRMHFNTIGKVTIDQQGLVSCTGDVEARLHMSRLPVQFDHVGGDFYCGHKQLVSLEGAPRYVRGAVHVHNNQLTSLQGAPRYVGTSFYCNDNQLTSLQGAPQDVGGNFYCIDNKLTSLEGAPSHIGSRIMLTYSPTLPLLRVLSYKMIFISDSPPQLIAILDKYTGQGKKGALPCAAELIKAGYKDNARW